MLSVIVPAYNERENIENTAAVLSDILRKNGTEFELMFVDDGSSDNTWELIEKLSERDSSIRGLHFSRNFGKEGAIFAGLRRCVGDCAVVIDCDLQHPPELIPEMLRLHEQGYEVVEAIKSSRGKESLMYRLFAKTFYRIMKSSSDVDLDRASDFKLMDRKVIDALNDLPERITFFRALSSWVGFKTVKVEFEVAPRNAGTTKWNFRKLLKFALNNITSFTNFPMQIVTILGTLFLLFALVMGIQSLVKYFGGQALEGFTTVNILILLSAAVIMRALGIIGYYMSKIYEEIKFRPRYIISEDTRDKKNKETKDKDRKEQDSANGKNS
ncbi:MAG: glycosyltransferase family 2 protein [Ruminiclostridium sp.]|nr:glycosyltransferase family 2 protein [Ruminiclostridium sp.]